MIRINKTSSSMEALRLAGPGIGAPYHMNTSAAAATSSFSLMVVRTVLSSISET
jgi:hypothetical protein